MTIEYIKTTGDYKNVRETRIIDILILYFLVSEKNRGRRLFAKLTIDLLWAIWAWFRLSFPEDFFLA